MTPSGFEQALLDTVSLLLRWPAQALPHPERNRLARMSSHARGSMVRVLWSVISLDRGMLMRKEPVEHDDLCPLMQPSDAPVRILRLSRGMKEMDSNA